MGSSCNYLLLLQDGDTTQLPPAIIFLLSAPLLQSDFLDSFYAGICLTDCLCVAAICSNIHNVHESEYTCQAAQYVKEGGYHIAVRGNTQYNDGTSAANIPNYPQQIIIISPNFLDRKCQIWRLYYLKFQRVKFKTNNSNKSSTSCVLQVSNSTFAGVVKNV